MSQSVSLRIDSMRRDTDTGGHHYPFCCPVSPNSHRAVAWGWHSQCSVPWQLVAGKSLPPRYASPEAVPAPLHSCQHQIPMGPLSVFVLIPGSLPTQTGAFLSDGLGTLLQDRVIQFLLIYPPESSGKSNSHSPVLKMNTIPMSRLVHNTCLIFDSPSWLPH